MNQQKKFTIQKDGSLIENIDAIFVFDYLHTDENDEFYRRNNNDFGEVVDNG